jgi:protein-S-isoprenylcysteine O-methyltransferase Ste14
LAFSSWLGALTALVLAFLAHLPCIAVEERELGPRVRPAYADYGRTRARLLPGLW